MKTIIKIILVFLPFVSSFASMQDTIYVMRSGMVLYKKAITDIDSISFENWKFNRRSVAITIAEDKNFSIFYQGLVATGLVDSLNNDRDRSYNMNDWLSLNANPYYQGGRTTDQLPKSRKYGFTVLMESDSVMRNYAVYTLSDLRAYAKSVYDLVYPEDASITDVANRKNSLNRFIAYHIINKKLSISKFIDAYDTDHMIKTFDMYEYLEPLCPNSLIEIKKERSSGLTNLINQSADAGSAIHIIKNYDDKDIYNGFYYGIDKIMTYNSSVIENLSGKRLRFDMASLFPELTNNNMRASGKEESWIYPPGYLKGLTFSKDTKFAYLNTNEWYLDFQGDEVFLTGVYDFSVVTPPIPKGTYEVRFGYQPTGWRGVAQLYFDSIPCGIPLDLRINADDDLIGWKSPGTESDDPKGYQNDKMMHNRGYMKGPSSYQSPSGYGQQIARNSKQVLRKVLGIYKFDQPGKHVFTVTAVMNGQFMFDFLEFIPIENIENEGVD